MCWGLVSRAAWKGGVGWGGREKRCPDVLALPPRCCVDGCSAISVLGVGCVCRVVEGPSKKGLRRGGRGGASLWCLHAALCCARRAATSVRACVCCHCRL